MKIKCTSSKILNYNIEAKRGVHEKDDEICGR